MTVVPINVRITIDGQTMIVPCTITAPDSSRRDEHKDSWLVRCTLAGVETAAELRDSAISSARSAIATWARDAWLVLVRLGAQMGGGL